MNWYSSTSKPALRGKVALAPLADKKALCPLPPSNDQLTNSRSASVPSFGGTGPCVARAPLVLITLKPYSFRRVAVGNDRRGNIAFDFVDANRPR